MLHTYLVLRDLRRAVRRSPAALRAQQDARLAALVRHAHARVPFLRRLWDEAGVGLETVHGVDDLARLPTVTKAALRAVPERELLADDADPAACNVLESSGSTSTPFRIFKREHEERYRRAGGLRILLEHGFRWWHRSGQFQILPGPPVWLQRFGVAPKQWISTTLPIERQLALLAGARAHVVTGTPTALRHVAHAAAARGLALPPARIVLAAGEQLDDASRAAVSAALRADPVAVYGTTETGYLAWQCELRRGLHVNADTHLVELLQGDAPAPPGALGEIVVTDLTARTMPFVRYRTGDLARAPLAACACGRGLPVVELAGRLSTTLRRRDGGWLIAPEVVEALARLAGVDVFRVRQGEDGATRVEVLDALDAATARRLADRVAALLEGSVTLARVGGWPDPGTGKTPAVTTARPVGWGAT